VYPKDEMQCDLHMQCYSVSPILDNLSCGYPGREVVPLDELGWWTWYENGFAGCRFDDPSVQYPGQIYHHLLVITRFDQDL
jgi:hypothetical protein